MNYKLSEEIRLAHRLKYRISGTWADKVAELEQELLEERASYEVERQRLRDALESAWERMDRARNILTEGNPTKHNNWGMLDTSLDRQALEKRHERGNQWPLAL